MPIKIPNHHDKFNKELLADRNIAIEFLNELLPNSLKDLLKLETLEQQKNSYLSDELKEAFSDIIWKIETNQKPIKICLLLEHKSYKDDKIVFQLLEYMALGYRTQLKENQELELIIPVVYYHGQHHWKIKIFEDFFESYPIGFQKYMPKFNFEFINLQTLSSDQILNLRNGMLASSLFIQRYYFDNKILMENFERIIKSLEPYLEKNSVNNIFVYLIHFLEVDKSILNKKLEKIPQILNSKIMSLYDQLILEGKAEGFAEGIEKTILNAFKNNIDLKTIQLISGESIEKIKAILTKNKLI